MNKTEREQLISDLCGTRRLKSVSLKILMHPGVFKEEIEACEKGEDYIRCNYPQIAGLLETDSKKRKFLSDSPADLYFGPDYGDFDKGNYTTYKRSLVFLSQQIAANGYGVQPIHVLRG